MDKIIKEIQEELRSSILYHRATNGDSRVELLKQFYSSIDKTTMKLEVLDYGFDFIKTMENAGITVDYVELKGIIHKYKFKNIKPLIYDYLIKQHIEQSGNVCGYFHKTHNNVFAFNLDNAHKDKNTEPTSQMKATVQIMRKYLNAVGIEPLITNSGRGYHLWVRLDKPIANEKIQDFMIKINARTQVTIGDFGMDKDKIMISMYPNKDTTYGSLRLFGSKHVKNQEFSHVITKDGVLDEMQSWIYFSNYINQHTITEEQLERALVDIDETLFIRAED